MKRRRLNILLIDDNEQDYTITYGLLTEIEGWRFNLEWVSTYDDAVARLARERYDVCLLGRRLDKRQGLGFVHRVSENGLTIPLILLTRPEDRQLAVEAMKAQAVVDYLIKGEMNASLLRQSIRYGIKYKEMAELLELQVAEHTLELATANEQLQQEVDRWRQAEHVLRERERRYRQLFDFGVDGVEILDSQGIIVDCNAMYQRLLGGSREEIVGKHTTAFTTDKIEEVFSEKLLPLLKQGGHIEGESELVCLDGSTRRVWRQFQTMHDEKGEFKGVVVYNRDITERMQAVEQLSDLALAIEQCPLALMLVDCAGKIHYVNFKFTELTSYTYEEVAGQALQTFKPEAQSMADYETIWNRVNAGEEWQGEFINRTKSGHVYWESIAIAPMYNVDNTITSFIVARVDITAYKQAEDAAMSSQRRLGGLATEHINDLTAANERFEREIAERKRVEQTLRQTQVRLKAQYKGIPVPTFSWQRTENDFILVDYNDAAEASNPNLADLVDKPVSHVFRDRPQVLADFAQCYAEKETVEREAPYQLLVTGETRYFVTTYNFVPPDLIIVHIQDITEHRQVETELKKRHDQLEATTAEHMAALTKVTAALQAEVGKRKQLEGVLQEKEERLKEFAANGTTKQRVEPGIAADQAPPEEATSGRAAELTKALAEEVMRREQAEEKLRQGEERLKEVANNIDDRLREQYRGIPIPTYSWQRIADEFVMVDCNDAAAQEMEQIVDFLGKTASEIFKNRPQVLADLARCYNEKRTVVREGPYKRVTTGKTHYFVTTYNFAPPTLVIVHIQDITEQKKMEAEFDACRHYLEEVTVTHVTALTEFNEALQEEIVRREQVEQALVQMKTRVDINQPLQQEVAAHEGIKKLQESRARLKAQYKLPGWLPLSNIPSFRSRSTGQLSH